MPPGRLAGGGFLHRLTPPLQADQGGDRIRRGFAGAGQFVVEGDQREDRPAPRFRREQRAEESIRVMGPGEAGKVLVEGRRVFHRAR